MLKKTLLVLLISSGMVYVFFMLLPRILFQGRGEGFETAFIVLTVAATLIAVCTLFFHIFFVYDELRTQLSQLQEEVRARNEYDDTFDMDDL